MSQADAWQKRLEGKTMELVFEFDSEDFNTSGLTGQDLESVSQDSGLCERIHDEIADHLESLRDSFKQ